MNCQYIIVYDENGEEILASNDYIGFSLSENEADQESKLRLLNHGVESVVLEPEYDEISGLETQLIGVRLKLDEDRYGALVMAVDPNIFRNYIIEDKMDERISSLAVGDDLLLIADKEDGLIRYANDTDMQFSYLSYYGLDPKQSFMQRDHYKINGADYYGLISDDSERIYGCFIADSSLTRASFGYGLGIGICYVIVYALTTYLTGRSYTEEFFEENVNQGEDPLKGTRIDIQLADGRSKKTIDPSRRFSLAPHYWDKMLPQQKTSVVFRVLSGLLIIYVLCVYRNKGNGSSSLIGYILSGQWSRGANLFAFFSIGLLIISAILVMLLLRLLLVVLCSLLDTKGETLCRLVFSLIEYAIIIAVLFYSFQYLGFNTTGLLASVSLISLALSLGAKDLVTDVLAGLSIVFEGRYQVGDMVEIDGYRGQVQEVGIRSTKLIGRGDNIKIIDNSDVRNVINMSRLNSWYPLEVTIPNDQPLEEVEAILEQQLPVIGEKIKEIINGPYYYGVLSFKKDSITLSILSECREENYHKVQRKLNKEIYDLFRKQNILLK